MIKEYAPETKNTVPIKAGIMQSISWASMSDAPADIMIAEKPRRMRIIKRTPSNYVRLEHCLD